jgi:glutamate-1-semialdehyde 2,1-aminomutase
MKPNLSNKLWQEAQTHFVGGVNSPVRAFRGVGGEPFFVRRAKGSHLWDVDGNEYVDYVGSWGPMILGHAHSRVVKAVQDAAREGTSFGIPNPHEIRLAQLVKAAFPSIEKVRFTSSGSEATMSAIRLARGFTKRDKILKFDGCYHGHGDSLLVKAGSGGATFGVPDSAGVPAALAELTLTIPFNDFEALETVLRNVGNELAAVIVEPIPANAGLFLPKPAFLERLRELTRAHGVVLIFDEVITGFRVAAGGAQELYGIQPDLTTLGKIIGGGLPVGAFGGKTEIMDCLAPLGPVYQAGTLSGNPLAMAAGIATLEELGIEEKAKGKGQKAKADAVYKKLDDLTAKLAAGIHAAATRAKLHVWQNRIGSVFCTFFTEKEVADYASAKTSDTARYAKFFHGMRERGFYFAPSQFEVGFVSLAHNDADIDATIAAANEAFRTL